MWSSRSVGKATARKSCSAMSRPGLQDRKLPRRGTGRKGFVNARELCFGQLEIPRPRVFGRVFRASGLGNREQRGPPHEETERDLARGRAMRGGDLLQNPTACRARA